MAEEKRPELIPDDVKKVIRDTFLKQLKEPVLIEVYTKQGENDQYNEATVALTKTFSELSDKVKVSFYTVGDDQAKKRNVLRSPTLLIAPDKYRIRYTGSPLGEEGRSFLVALMMASTGMSILTAPAMAKIAAIKDKRDIQVFVTPTCPYCPQMARAVYQLALANPKVHPEVIEVSEFPELAQRYGVRAVPLTIIADKVAIPGAVQEQVLVEQLLKAVQSPALASSEAAGPTSPMSPAPEAPQRGQQRPSGLVIP